MGERPQSRILDYYDEAGAEKKQDDGLSYSTPVFVPAHPRYPAADGEEPLIAFELLEHPAGPAVPVAFTTLEKLVAALGPAQPWIASSIGPFTEAMRDAGLPMVHLDPAIEPGHRNWTLDDLEEYARKVS